MDFADEFVNMKRELRDLKTYVPRSGGGEPGPPGEAATVTVGSTTTGAAGTNASVTNSGDEHNAILNFTIPRGNTGAAGSAATVAVGTTSTLPAGSAATVSNSGTSSAAVLNFGIPKGDTGATGSAATVSVGTTSTLPAGSSATVTNSGSSSAAVLNFGIPTGAQGPAGQNGQNGQDGQDGQDGYSPSATVTQTSTGATITITDKDGTTTANIYNGSLDGLVVYASNDPGNGSAASITFSIYSDSGLTQGTTWSTVFEAFARGIPVFLKYGTTTQYIYQVESVYFPSSGSGRVTWKSQTATLYSYYTSVAPTDSSATRYIQEIPRDALDWSSFNSTYTTSTSQASGLSTTWKNLYNFSVSSYPVGAKIAVVATLITSTTSSTDHYARIGYNDTYGYEANQVGSWAQNLTCMYSFTKVSGVNTVYIQGRVSTNSNSAWGYRAISWRIG